MKRVIIALATVFAAFAVSAAPRRVALVVQNHTSNAPSLPMAAFADTLTAKLSGKVLRVINPQNAIGVSQNRTAAGEVMPDASAQEIGRILNADGVVTASILEFTGEDIGMPAVAHSLKVRIAMNLTDSATGETICGISNAQYSKNYTLEQVKSGAAPLYENLMHDAASKCAAELLTKVSKSRWKAKKAKEIRVFFGCNVLGADVQIDGLSYGTCPGEFPVTPGVHNILVSYPPYYQNFERRAMFKTDGQTYAVVLQITPDGEAQRLRTLEYETKLLELKKAQRDGDLEFEKRKKDLETEQAEHCELFKKQMKLADAMLKRYKLSGETDDFVRKTIAEGTSIYWKNSFGRIAITDGSANNIEFATPSTDAADLAVPPNPKEIGEGLQKFLMKGLGH